MKLSNNWKFDPNRSPHDFVEENMGIYSKAYLEDFPHRAYIINDGDTEEVIDWMIDEHLEDIKSDMADCYFFWLGDNWD